MKRRYALYLLVVTLILGGCIAILVPFQRTSNEQNLSTPELPLTGFPPVTSEPPITLVETTTVRETETETVTITKTVREPADIITVTRLPEETDPALTTTPTRRIPDLLEMYRRNREDG